MNAYEIKALLHPDDIEKADNIVAKMIKAISQNQTECTIEYRIKHKNGDYRWVSDKYKIISDNEGNNTYIIGNVMDITELKEAKDALNVYLKNTAKKD